jgi:hypothetical protein
MKVIRNGLQTKSEDKDERESLYHSQIAALKVKTSSCKYNREWKIVRRRKEKVIKNG